MLNYYDSFSTHRKNKRICGPEATLAEIWQAKEAHQIKKIAHITTLSLEFQQTHTWNKLSPLTQKDYINCHRTIITRDTSTGKLGDVSETMDRWPYQKMPSRCSPTTKKMAATK